MVCVNVRVKEIYRQEILCNMNGGTIYYLRWPVDSCDQCKTVAPHLSVFQVRLPVVFRFSPSGNHNNISKTFQCDCVKDHYFNLQNFRCEHAGTIGISALLVNYLVALPLSILSLVIACRFLFVKIIKSEQKKPQQQSS